MGSTMHQNNTFPLPPPVLSSTVDHVHLEGERVFLLHALQIKITTLNRLVVNQALRAGMVVPNLSTVILNQKLQRTLDSLEAEARNNNTTDGVRDGLRVYLIKSIHMSALSSLTGIQDKTGSFGNQLFLIAHLTDRLLSVERRIEETLINNGTLLSPYSSSSAGMDHVINSLRHTLISQGLNFLSSPSPSPSPSSSSSSIAAANSSINRSSTTISAVRIRFVTEYSPSSRDLRSSEAGQETNSSHGARGTTETDERLKRKSIVDSEKGEVCSVCLEEIKDRDENGKATMACSHTFHFSCILEWMKRKQNCPLCRYDVNPDKRRRR